MGLKLGPHHGAQYLAGGWATMPCRRQCSGRLVARWRHLTEQGQGAEDLPYDAAPGAPQIAPLASGWGGSGTNQIDPLGQKVSYALTPAGVGPPDISPAQSPWTMLRAAYLP